MPEDKADFISDARAAQAILADEIATSLQQSLRPRFEEAHQRLAKRAGLDPEDVDPEAARELLFQELRRDALVALRGYTDWLAATVWRKHRDRLPDRMALPPCRVPEQAAILEKYTVDGEMLRLVMEDVAANRRTLPIVGRIQEGTILVSRSQLEAWAKHYDWSED